MWNFFSPHGYATVGNKSYTWRNNLSTAMCWSADGVAVSHPISLIHIVHVTVVILHNKWFHGVSLLIAKLSLVGALWIFISMWISLSSAQNCCQVTCGPYLNADPFHFYFLGSKILWYDLPVCSNSLMSGYRISREEIKCRVQSLTTSVSFHSQSCHFGLCCCQVCHTTNFQLFSSQNEWSFTSGPS